jgi:hypothetical protein
LTLRFFQLFFSCPPPCYRDDRHLLARARASDFSVAWQFHIPMYMFYLFKEKYFFLQRSRHMLYVAF